jgi:hypothetical protein
MNRDARLVGPDGRRFTTAKSAARIVAATSLVLALASTALADEGPNPYQGTQPAQPPYAPDQRLIISDPQDGTVIDHSPDRVTLNFRRFDFEDLLPSSLELRIDGVEYTEQLRFWTDVAWVDLPPAFLGPGEHQILASMRSATGILYSTTAIVPIVFGPCAGGCPWPFSPTSEPNVVSNIMEDWQDFGSSPYFHGGLDMRADAGTDVHACAAGKVVRRANYRSGDPIYWEVAIQDATGMIWQYHHLDAGSITVNVNDNVAQGQVIGQVVEWPNFVNGVRYNHLHLNTVRWKGGGPIPGPYVDGWAYYNPFLFLTSGSYSDIVKPLEFDIYYGTNENPKPFAAQSDTPNPGLSGQVDVLARLKDQMTTIGPPDTLGQPYDLGIYDLSWSASALDTKCGMGWVPRTRLMRFDMVPGGTTVAGNAAALKMIYRQDLTYKGVVFGAVFDYYDRRFSYALTNTKNGFPSDVNGYWDTAQNGSLGPFYPDGHYVVRVYARDFYGNETVTPDTVELTNGVTWNGICPPYIVSLKVLQGPYLTSSLGGLYQGQAIEVPISLGDVMDGSSLATVGSPGWPAWNFDLPDHGLRVAIGLLNGHVARIEYVPLLGDVIVNLDAEVQVLPIGGVFNPNLPSTQPVSLRLSTRLARDPAGPALIGRPAPYGDISFDLTMAKTILVNGEPMTLRLGGGGGDASWGLSPLAVESIRHPQAPVAIGIETRPNPLRSTGMLTLGLTLDRDRDVEVDLHDSQGRRVSRLFAGSLLAGTHWMHWDARSESGDPLSPGIYFLRAWNRDAEALRKVVVMR